MANPRKRKQAIVKALKALAKAETSEQKQALIEIAENVANTADEDTHDADWLLRRAEDIAEALKVDEKNNKPKPASKKTARKKKTTTKKVTRGKRKATKKTTN